MQALYDLTAPGGRAPTTTHAGDTPLHAGPHLLEVRTPAERQGRGRWWCPDAGGYTDQLDRAGLYRPDSDEVRDKLRHPDDGHSHPVDARVVVGPAVRLLATLREVDAACDTDEALAELVDPDDAKVGAHVEAYVQMRDAAAAGQALSELLGMTPTQLLEFAAGVPVAPQAVADTLQPAVVAQDGGSPVLLSRYIELLQAVRATAAAVWEASSAGHGVRHNTEVMDAMAGALNNYDHAMGGGAQ